MGGTLTSSAFTCTSIRHSRESCKCVYIYREADVNHICPVFLAKREREIFVTRVIGFPAICIKISRCACWCLTWDQLKKEGISRTNCVHVDTWLVCVCMCASLLQCVCFKVKQNFSSKNLCSLLGPSFCLLSFPLQVFPVPQTSINLDFLATFSPHTHPHTFSVTPPTNCLWLTLVAVFFHSGTASFLEEIPEYYKLPRRQREISSYTTATN